MTSLSVEIKGDKELQREATKAAERTPAAMDEALREWGEPTLRDAESMAPRLTGELAGSGDLVVTKGRGELVFTAEHAPVIDLAGRGKYRSLVERYGPPPRFGYRAAFDNLEELEKVSNGKLEKVASLNGWAT